MTPLEKAVCVALFEEKPRVFTEIYGDLAPTERAVRNALFKLVKRGVITRTRISNGGTSSPVMKYSLVKK